MLDLTLNNGFMNTRCETNFPTFHTVTAQMESKALGMSRPPSSDTYSDSEEDSSVPDSGTENGSEDGSETGSEEGTDHRVGEEDPKKEPKKGRITESAGRSNEWRDQVTPRQHI